MELTFEATFDGEVFRPTEEVNLKPNTKVTVTVEEKVSLKSASEKIGEPYSFLKYLDSVSIDAPPDYSVNYEQYLSGGKTLE
jgi:predicted DNA-binding antitoxin AbrB/MazE fold protein